MALRRLQTLRGVVRSTALVLRRSPTTPPPAGSPFHGLDLAGSLPGRLALRAADVIVTNSHRTLRLALSKQLFRGRKVIHYVYGLVDDVVASDEYLRLLERVDLVVLPFAADAPAFARVVGLPLDRVGSHDDFVLPSERLISTAEGRVVTAVSRLRSDARLIDLIRGFALARPAMTEWQLRICGWGPELTMLQQTILDEGLSGTAILMGPVHHIDEEYLDAGMVVELNSGERPGLSVVEALSAGVPVLGAAGVPAVDTLIRDDANGMVLPYVDPVAVADALIAMSDLNHRKELASSARATPVTSSLHLDLADLATIADVAPESLRFADGTSLASLMDHRGIVPAAGVQSTTPRVVPVPRDSTEMSEEQPQGPRFVRRERRAYRLMDDLSPQDARRSMLREVLSILEPVGAFVVKGSSYPGTTVGVPPGHRRQSLELLAAGLVQPELYCQCIVAGGSSQPIRKLTSDRLASLPDRCQAICIAQLWTTTDGSLTYAMEYGTTVEFWEDSPESEDDVVAPRKNSAGLVFHRSYLTPADIELEGASWPSIDLFDRAMIDEVTFPVDVVYTWVDGAESGWRSRLDRAKAESHGLAYHPQAQADNRFMSRDELRYSLRSVEMYAPWVRHIFLVTDRQTPSWLAVEHPGLTIVDHRDIFTDPTVLPVFNSSAIISQLHHIDGLSEHYLYLNDDMFIGRDVRPDFFWHGNGIAKVFPSRQARPFGPAHPGAEPHINISKNIRSILEESVGRSLSTAIRHTPYPQLRSVNFEMEERFPDVFTRTAAQRFRHHTDVATDQLFHYYARATGRAVASTISYDYVNVGDSTTTSRLRYLLATRSRSVFCLNDAPEPGAAGIPIAQVRAFLEAYFPIASRFESDVRGCDSKAVEGDPSRTASC